MAKAKAQSSNKAVKKLYHGKIRKCKQTNIRKNYIKQRVFKHYSLRVRTCHLGECTKDNQKLRKSKALRKKTSGKNKALRKKTSRKSKALRKKTSGRSHTVPKKTSRKKKTVQKKTPGNHKIGIPSPKAQKKRLHHRNVHKSTQTDISMTFSMGNTSGECDFLLASSSKGEQCIFPKQQYGNIQVMIKGARIKHSDSIQRMPSTSKANPPSFPEISATVPSKSSVGTMTDQIITADKAGAATKAVKFGKRNVATMTEKNITHDKKISAKLPHIPPKRNAAVMTDPTDLAKGTISKRQKRNTVVASEETEDNIISLIDLTAADTDVPQKEDDRVVTENYAQIDLFADETLPDTSDEESYVADFTKN